MKKCLFFFAIALSLFNSPLLFGQVGPYNFVTLQEEYQPITGGTQLFENMIWDDPEFSIDLPFDYNLFEFPVDSIFIAELSAFFTSSETYEYENLGAVIFPLISDILDRGDADPSSGPQSPVRFDVEGDTGDRIFKFEIANAGFFEELANTDTMPSFVNLQFWLYENGGAFEYRYGPSHIDNPDVIFEDYGGPVIGCVDSIGTYDYDDQIWYFLSGDPASPEVDVHLGQLISQNSISNLDAYPADMTVYRFYISDVASKDIPASDLAINLLANPVRHNLNLLVYEQELLGRSAELSISNSLGQPITINNQSLSASNLIPIGHLSAGNYFLTVSTKEGFKTMKFVNL